MSEAVSPINLWFDRGSSAVMVVLVVVLAASLAKFTWFMVAGEEPVITTGKPLVAGQQQKDSAAPINIRQLQSWQLFGKAGQVVAAPQPKKKKSADVITSLPLTLEGVFVATVAEESSAIIAQKGKPGLYYRIADKVPGNAVLDSVLEDRVILDRNGRLEALKFPKQSDKGIKTSKSRTKKRNTKSTRSRKTAKRGGLPQNRVSDLFTGGGSMPTPSSVVSSLTQEIAKDSKKFMKEMGVEPVPMAQGGGYRVTGAAPREILKMVGLRENDVIKSVNGQPIGNIEDDLPKLESFANGECDLALELQRGSSIFSVNFDVCSGHLF